MTYDIPPINHSCSYQCEIKHLDNIKKSQETSTVWEHINKTKQYIV